MTLFTEFLGTVALMLVILKFMKPIPIAIAMGAVIYFFKGHFHPLVSGLMFLNKKIGFNKFVRLVGAQTAGALTALYLSKML